MWKKYRGYYCLVAIIIIPFVIGIIVGAMSFPKTIVKTEYKEKIVEVPIEVPDEIKQSKTLHSITETEYTEICKVVMAEAGGESYAGQMAVAQCILNACEKSGSNPFQAIKQYKYTNIRKTPSESVKNAVADVFYNGLKVTDEQILYFYAPNRCKSDWHETLRFVCEIDNHRFFAENIK